MSDKAIKQIISLIKQDDMKGISLLYELYYKKIYAIAFVILKDHQKSEDTVHNVILKLINMDKAMLPNEKEVAWLNKVIKNAAIDVMRKDSKIVFSDDMESLLSCSKSISDYVDLDGFNQMIKGLDEKRKNIITLRVIGDYTFKDISKILSINVNTVRWLYNTGLTKIKKTLIALGVVTLSFFIVFAISLTVSLVWNDLEITYLWDIVSLGIGSSNSHMQLGVLEISPSAILLLYSGYMFIVQLLLFIFSYHNAYELPTKAKLKKKNKNS